MFRALIFSLIFILILPAFARDEGYCRSILLRADQRWNPDDSDVAPELSRFYEINDLLESAAKANDTTNTQILASEYLFLAKRFPCNWNYGNAIHDANSALGILSINAGDIVSAKKYLLAAGRSSGSPQLDSFGPSFELAKEMIKHRELSIVHTYLESVSTFWKMDQGVLDTWLSQLKRGEAPDFSQHCRKST